MALFMDAVASALLAAQGIGRIGNYFNKKLFGGPTSLPWGPADPGGLPAAGLFGPAAFWSGDAYPAPGATMAIGMAIG